MAELAQRAVTEDDVAAARVAVRRGVRGLLGGLTALFVVSGFAAGAIAAAIVDDGGVIEMACAVGLATVAVGGPLLYALYLVTQRRGMGIALESAVQERLMESDARRRDFEAKLARALEMSDDESAAFDTIRRGLQLAVPESSVELLLADNSHAHLDRVVSVVPDGGPVGAAHECPVASPDQCVAARRAQTQVFPDSDALDGCPMLRGRGPDTFSAVCVPVSIMGRTVGVVHATGPIDEPLDDVAAGALQVLANLSGNRLGMLRIMAETQLQAMTDGLTGLMNRRSFENRARILRSNGTDYAFVMADLDHFKGLNDTHGHETGDRALRVFAETLRESVRAEDLVCRYGGEEFTVLLPGVDLAEAVEIMDRVRESLARTTRRGDVPSFTASYGVAESTVASDFEDLLLRADRALFAAKDAGRDCICIDGHSIAVAPNLTAIN
ncbi:MAG TPA: GGDEF domain-containing protein [Acidimicrobiia bacterium]